MAIVDLFVSILFLFIGTFSLSAALFDWNWFFQSVNASLFVRWFGRRGARFFYAAVGISVITIGILMLTGVMN